MKSILFNTAMVQAILEGRKTTTRRIIKNAEPFGKVLATPKGIFSKKGLARHSPYHIGEILYVRETWQEWTGGYAYKVRGDYPQSFIDKWRPSIHMPKEAARIFLKVTNVKVERLQDIKFSDLRNEGILPDKEYEEFENAIEANLEVKFATLWDSTVNKKDIDQYGFIANPWVWVIEFERIEKSEVENNEIL